MTLEPVLAVALLHALATTMMGGLIWFVQVVHYPLFAEVGRPSFAAYEAAHTRRTTMVVGPLMLVEAGTAAALATLPLEGPTRFAAILGLGLLAAVWLSTFLVQVPCHRRLGDGFDERAWRRLVATNRVRTLLWTVRAVLALWLVLAIAARGAGHDLPEPAP